MCRLRIELINWGGGLQERWSGNGTRVCPFGRSGQKIYPCKGHWFVVTVGSGTVLSRDPGVLREKGRAIVPKMDSGGPC
jgi:hypothetical protein